MGKRKQKRKRSKHHSRTPVSTNRAVPFSFARPETNSRGALTVVPQFPDKIPESRILRSPQGAPGIYLVTYILSVPGRDVFLSDLSGEKLASMGSSLLSAPQGTTQMNLELYNEAERVPVIIRTNKDGQLSQIKMRVKGNNFVEVQRFCHDLIHPVLSALSFQYDVSLDFGLCELIEEETQVRRYLFGMIGKVRTMDPSPRGDWVSTEKFRRVFSAYREGLNATNVFYQVLSFYRVIEGVRGIRRQRRQSTVADSGQWREPHERIPNTVDELPPNPPWINASFKEYLGKKFTVVLDEFREVFRNAIAHLDPEQEVLLGDRFDDVTKCENAVPVLKFIAREMLQEELRNDMEYNHPRTNS